MSLLGIFAAWVAARLSQCGTVLMNVTDVPVLPVCHGENGLVVAFEASQVFGIAACADGIHLGFEETCLGPLSCTEDKMLHFLSVQDLDVYLEE